MGFCWDWVLWIAGLYVLYRVVDWLVRYPYISRPDQKYILITGCDTGFGHEIAKRLDLRTAWVIAACLTEKGEDELRKVTTHRLKTIRMDVSDPASVQKAFEEVKEYLPEGKGRSPLLIPVLYSFHIKISSCL